MTALDWWAIALGVLVIGGFSAAIFLYLRTAYRKGGWPSVKTAAGIAAFALIAFYVVRVAENSELDMLKKATDWLTR